MHAATFTVNSTADTANLQANCVNNAAPCTLRSAVQAANAAAGPDTIVLPAGSYLLTLLGPGENNAATGDLDITAVGGALTIAGAGAATTIIDGNHTDRIFETIGAATVTLTGVTLKDGNALALSGGAIATSGGTNLTLTNVIMTGNTSGLEGAAIDNAANAASIITMNTVVISNNISAAGGDIIANGRNATLTITNGTISGNNETAISNKQGSTLTLTNVTVSGNATTGGGGAIDNLGTANLQNVTINLNTGIIGAGNAGGIRNQGGATLNIHNTIVSNNTPRNCVPTVAFTSQGNNLSSDASCGLAGAGDVNNTTPLLGALADNGGAVPTHALLIGSPAIDTGAVCATTDARGIARPVDGNSDGLVLCDKGAFEFRPQKIVVTLPSPFDFGVVTTGASADHAITLTNAGDGDLIVGSVALVDPLGAPFSKLLDNCSGLTLKLIPVTAKNSCTITTRFAPAVAGAAAPDTFDIPSNDPVTPAVSFTLSGTGTAALVPLISVTDSITPINDNTVPFGGVAVGGSADATITITNTGTADLVLGTIASANALAAPFTILNNTCAGKTLAPSLACTLTVRFAPTADGAASDTFDIPSTGLASVTMTVTGTGGVVTTGTGGNNAPSNPVLVSPANDAAGVSTTTTFIWNKSTDPDGDALTYHFSTCTDQGMTTGCTGADVAAAAPLGLLFAGLGSMGAGIILIGFVAAGGMKRSRLSIFLITLVLLSGALFASCGKKSDSTPPPAPIVAGTGQASHSVTGLAANTTYYWKVVADDGKGGTSSSPVWTYKTQ